MKGPQGELDEFTRRVLITADSVDKPSGLC